MKPWYEELFENFAESYDREVFTQGTVGEVDFIEQELGFDKEKTILDIGCGTGRHAVELARRGYRVTGIDLSTNQLDRARQKAEAAGVDVTLFQCDARDFTFEQPFDAAIMLCEGGFSLMETDQMNFRILENAAKAIRPGGTFIMTTLNALYPLFQNVKQFLESHESAVDLEKLDFDLMTFRETSTVTVTDDSGRQKTLHCNERYYTPSEIRWLLESVGFVRVDILGCKLGAYSRDDRLTPKDFEMLVVAQKG